MFKIFVKPALKNKSGFYASKLFDTEGTTRKWRIRRHYNSEKVLRLSFVKDCGFRWTHCNFIPEKLHDEALVLRRTTIGGQKLWLPVRPSSSGLSKWTELVVPKMVGNTPIWASAEGIVGYLRPVKILGVQVWLPTSSTGNETEETPRKQLKPKRKSDDKSPRQRKIIYSTVRLKSGSVITEKRPKLVILDIPKNIASVRAEIARRHRERILCRKALKTIARKLLKKEDSVYPHVDLDASSSESNLEMENTNQRHDEEKGKKFEVTPRPPRDRQGEFFRIWGEENQEVGESFRKGSVEGRAFTSHFLSDEEVPIITAIGQPLSWMEDENDST